MRFLTASKIELVDDARVSEGPGPGGPGKLPLGRDRQLEWIGGFIDSTSRLSVRADNWGPLSGI